MRIHLGSSLPKIAAVKQAQSVQFGSSELALDVVMFSDTVVKKPQRPEEQKPKGTNKPKPKGW